MKKRLEFKKVGYCRVNKALVNFEAILKAKNVPLAKKEIKNGQILFNGKFKLNDSQSLPFGIVFDNKEEGIIDFQIVYHKLAYVTNFDKKNQVLAVLNELNEMKTGYYRICLAGDGEIYMRLLSRTTEDVRAAYEMMIVGSTIAKSILPKIEETVGKK